MSERRTQPWALYALIAANVAMEDYHRAVAEANERVHELTAELQRLHGK
jgi:hypothetical protein